MKPDTKAIRARAEAAMAGPWTRHPNPRFYVQWSEAHGGASDEQHEANAQFIAAARTDVPALCSRIEALERALREIAHGCMRNGRVDLDEIDRVARAALKGETP